MIECFVLLHLMVICNTVESRFCTDQSHTTRVIVLSNISDAISDAVLKIQTKKLFPCAAEFYLQNLEIIFEGFSVCSVWFCVLCSVCSVCLFQYFPFDARVVVNTSVSPNRIGRNFGNLLVFVSSFMDNYRANGVLGGPSSTLKRGVFTDLGVFDMPNSY